jgi:exosortase/archaeosortase family protein
MTVFWSAYQNCSIRSSLAALLAVVIMSMFMNWLRVLLIVVAGYFFGMDTPIVNSHYFFGWLLFLAAFLVLWRVLNQFRIFEPAAASDPIEDRYAT